MDGLLVTLGEEQESDTIQLSWIKEISNYAAFVSHQQELQANLIERYHTVSEGVDEVIRDLGFREETPQVADEVGQGLSSKGSWVAYAESVFQKSRRVLYGDLYHEGSPSEEDSEYSQKLERRVFFANLGSVEELKDLIFNTKQVVHFIESRSTSAEFLNFCVSKEFRSSLLDAMKSRNWEEVESMVMPIAAALPRRAAIYEGIYEGICETIISLASLLSSVEFQYLISLVGKGGTKTHSSGSLVLRSRYISIVLFLGAYIWIKFREVAPPSEQKPSQGLHRKCGVNDLGVKVYSGNYEPRFKPPGFRNYISVGSFEEEEDARIIYQILAFYYGREVPGGLPLLNGSTYPIPRMTEEEQHLDPIAKKEWAKGKAKAVLDEYKGALMMSFFDCPLDSQGVQAPGDISNTLPPDAGAGCGGQAFQIGSQSDGLLPISPGTPTPNVDPGMQDHVADHAAGGVGVSDEPPQLQHLALEENQPNNVNPDDLSILRLVKELQHQQQLQQFRIQQQESRIQQQESRSQQQETRISELERHQQLQELEKQQLKSRISELEGEVERLRSREPARKRICVGLSLRHDSQN